MRYFTRLLAVSCATLLAYMPQLAAAQASNFAPVMMTFEGNDTFTYAPSSALDIAGSGTVEMWVQASWRTNPGYDPAVLSYQGQNGPRLAVLITGDAKALGVYSGRFFNKIPFDFSDGQLHHVALIIVGEQITVMIDGEVLTTLAFGMAELPANTFTIGSMGGYSPFVGNIGQIRIWSLPIDPETLVQFSWRPLASDGPAAHPDIKALVGASAFANPETGGFIFFAPNQDVNVTQTPDDSIDDSGLNLTVPTADPRAN
jgi:hypothetical protein